MKTNLQKTKKLCVRLRKAIHSDKILKKYGITVSGGATQYRKKESEKSFKERADKALYKAKNSGRDRFVVV